MPSPTREYAIPLQLAAATSNALVSTLLLALLARALGEDEFGGYVATLSLAVVLLVLLEGGWPQRVYRESTLGGHESSAALTASAMGHALLAGAVLVGLGLWVSLGVPGLGAALLCMLLVAMMNLVSARMRAAGRFALEAGWQVGGRTTSALAILSAVWLGWSEPAWLFLAWAAGLGVILLLGSGRWLALPRWQGWRMGFALTLPFLLVEALGALLMKGDVAVLRGWGADGTALAHYAASTRLNEAALLLFAPVGNVLLRSLRLAHQDRAAFDSLWRSWVLRAAALGVAAVGGSCLLGNWLMGTVFGPDYAIAGGLLRFTSLMLPFALGNIVMVVALLARGDEGWMAWRLGPVAVLLVLGMGLGWELWEARGAALAVALSQALFWGLALLRLSAAKDTADSAPSSPDAQEISSAQRDNQ